MHVPDEFSEHIGERFGADAAEWLERLPKTFEHLFDEWDLTGVGQPTHGDLGLVIPVRTRSVAAVIKLAYPDTLFTAEAHWLQTHITNPNVVDVYDVDLAAGALLLEHLVEPNLWSVSAIEAARTIGRLHQATLLPDVGNYPDLADRFTPGLLSSWNDRLGSPLPADTTEYADETALSLLESRKPEVVNEDLYSSHVRTAAGGGWKVSDPRPVLGEAAYGLFPFLVDRWDNLAVPPEDVVTAASAGLDETRVYGWLLVHAVEYGLWAQRSGFIGDANRARRISTWARNSN
jgi:streptomycin 6-kinase